MGPPLDPALVSDRIEQRRREARQHRLRRAARESAPPGDGRTRWQRVLGADALGPARTGSEPATPGRRRG